MGEHSPSPQSSHTHTQIQPQSPNPETPNPIPPETNDDDSASSAGASGSIVSSTTIEAQRVTELGIIKVENKCERKSESSEQVVNPWEVSSKDGGKIDYDKLIDKFGCKRIDKSLIDRVQRLTCRQPHIFLCRGVFFTHRDFNEILDLYERGEKFYLYTGRGPSSEALHLGHLIPFMFANSRMMKNACGRT